MDRDKKLVVISIMLLSVIGTLLGVALFYAENSLPVSVPVDYSLHGPNSTLSNELINWSCRDHGYIWKIGPTKMIAVCPEEYIDIRQVINNKVTIKGIHLSIGEWTQLVSKIPEITTIMAQV